MTHPICRPLSKARTEPVKRSGLALSDFRGTSDTLFKEIENPHAYLARLRRTGDALDNWRDGLPLDPEIQPYTLGWPVDVEFDPGYLLDEAGGIPKWEVERAVEGLIAGEASYIEMASGLLIDAEGCVMEMPGGVIAVLIRADAFKKRVVVRRPLLLFGAMNA